MKNGDIMRKGRNTGFAAMRRITTIAVVALWAMFGHAFLGSQPAHAQTYTVLHNFTGGNDGGDPQGALIQVKGNLLGTTAGGGVYGFGAVYLLSETGKEDVLYNFEYFNGAQPNWGALLQDSTGGVYGVTLGGGYYAYKGVLYKLSKGRGETIIHQFGGPGDGLFAYSGVVADAEGNLYGSTQSGGTTGSGTVFKVDSAGNYSILYNFTGKADGGSPSGGLVWGSDGELYGATQGGGSGACVGNNGYPCGTLFKIDTAGNLTTLYSFNGTDGAFPYDGALAFDAAGNIYGTTTQGGAFGAGTVFKVDTSGTETVLYSFTGNADGFFPEAGVVLDSKGNIYGITTGGGNLTACQGGCGVVFKLSKAGEETVLHTFIGTDGAYPELGGLLGTSKGVLYGVTPSGGSSGQGVVFSLK